MAIKLEDKTNVTAPGGDYPFGDIKDDPGDATGTPVNREVYADFHQFFAKLIDASGVVANGLLDNVANGFQYFEALVKLFTPGAWTNITLLNGWAAVGALTPQYRLDAAGKVHLRGRLNAAGSSSPNWCSGLPGANYLGAVGAYFYPPVPNSGAAVNKMWECYVTNAGAGVFLAQSTMASGSEVVTLDNCGYWTV